MSDLVDSLARCLMTGGGVIIKGKIFYKSRVPDYAFPCPCDTCTYRHICDDMIADVCAEVASRSDGWDYIGINNKPKIRHGKDNKRK